MSEIYDKRDPFVAEVMRIIRKEIYRMVGEFRCNSETVILVSQRFHYAAVIEVERVNRILGVERNDDGKRTLCLTLKGLLLAPAPWLSDYEFEIRNP